MTLNSEDECMMICLAAAARKKSRARSQHTLRRSKPASVLDLPWAALPQWSPRQRSRSSLTAAAVQKHSEAALNGLASRSPPIRVAALASAHGKWPRRATGACASPLPSWALGKPPWCRWAGPTAGPRGRAGPCRTEPGGPSRGRVGAFMGRPAGPSKTGGGCAQPRSYASCLRTKG